MKKNTIIGYTAIFALTVCSCSPIYYSGSTQNVAMLEEQGSFRAGASGNDSRGGGEFSYAVTDHFGVLGNGTVYFPKDDDNGNGGSGSRFEFGGLYYTKLGEKMRFETNAIVGFGNVENHFPATAVDYPGTNGKISANIFSYGIQPALGFSSKYFQMAFSCKLFGLNYNGISGNLIYQGENQQQYLADNKSNFMVEPALTLRGGFEFLKLQLQFGRSLNMTNSSFKMDDNFMTVGLLFSVH